MISNIAFTGRETMLIDAAKYAEKTAQNRAAKVAQIAQENEAIEKDVVKASSILMELPVVKSHPYVAYDAPTQIGKIINQVG